MQLSKPRRQAHKTGTGTDRDVHGMTKRLPELRDDLYSLVHAVLRKVEKSNHHTVCRDPGDCLSLVPVWFGLIGFWKGFLVSDGK